MFNTVYETFHDPYGNMTVLSLILNSTAGSVNFSHFTLKYNEDEYTKNEGQHAIKHKLYIMSPHTCGL